MRSSVIAVIERAVVVVIGVDVVSGAGLLAMDVNRRAAMRGMQMRCGQQAGNREHHRCENRQPPVGQG